MPTDEPELMTEDTLKYCDTLGMVDGHLLGRLIAAARAARALKEELEKARDVEFTNGQLEQKVVDLLDDNKNLDHSNKMLREENARLKDDNAKIAEHASVISGENARLKLLIKQLTDEEESSRDSLLRRNQNG